LKENGKVLHTVSNDANGKIQFPELTLTEEKTYTYTISEKAGNEAGVTYDTATHKVTVKVVDNGAGKLVATVTDNNPTFTNTYKAAPAKEIIKATKVLDGKKLFVAKIMMLNPIAQMLQDMRHFIVDPVNFRGWDIVNNKLIALIPYLIPFVILALGLFFFNKNAKRFAEIL